MDAGKLRHRVSIQSKTNTQDPDTGEIIVTWTDHATCIPCSIEPLSVKDYMQSRADQSNVAVRITIRHRSGLDSTMRLVGSCGCHMGRIYNPMGFLEDKDSGREYMTVPCSEGVNEG